MTPETSMPLTSPATLIPRMLRIHVTGPRRSILLRHSIFTMKIKCFRPMVLMFLLMTGIKDLSAQGIISYVDVTFMTGSNLFSNPFDTPPNDLNTVLPGPSVPEGTSVSLWDTATAAFTNSSIYSNGAWSSDLILPPGTGALVVVPAAFSIPMTGDLLGHDGIEITNDAQLALPPPPLFSGPNGIYLLGDKCITTDVGTNIFVNILGRLPFVGEQVTQISGTNTYASTYLGNGLWDTVPTLNPANSAFLKIQAVLPPPLTIVYANGLAIVSWPLSASGWTLQTNTTLSPATWGNFLGPVPNNTVTNSPVSGNLFFRLSYP